MNPLFDKIPSFLKAAFPTHNMNIAISDNQINIECAFDFTLNLAAFLKDQPSLAFSQLIDVIAIDYLKEHNQFEIIYHFLSMKHNLRCNVKNKITLNDHPPSLMPVFINALWHEREVYDMFGIIFNHHPDLSRILTEYNFEGYPLRKDFPVFGHKQVRYDELLGKIVHENVDLPQMNREFEAQNEWIMPNYILPESQEQKS